MAYKGMVDCFARTLKEEGFRALFKVRGGGLLPYTPSWQRQPRAGRGVQVTVPEHATGISSAMPVYEDEKSWEECLRRLLKRAWIAFVAR